MSKKRRTDPELRRLREQAILAKSDRDAILETCLLDGKLLTSFALAYAGIVEASHPLTGDTRTGASAPSSFEWSEPGAAVRRESKRVNYFRRRIRLLRDEMLGADVKPIRGLWCEPCRRFGRFTDRFCATCGRALKEKE